MQRRKETRAGVACLRGSLFRQEIRDRWKYMARGEQQEDSFSHRPWFPSGNDVQSMSKNTHRNRAVRKCEMTPGYYGSIVAVSSGISKS